MNALRAGLFAVITIMMTAVATMAVAAPNFPALTGRVVDQAAVLSSDQQVILSNRLRDFETQTGHQMAVATVSSLQGYDVRDFGYQLGRAWALGSKDKNDGVLLLVAPTEHKVSIEVGYGLEGDLTDAISSVIISHAIVPKFKTGDYFSGIYAGVDDIQKVVGGQGAEIIQAAQQQQQAQQASLADAMPFIIFFIFVAFIIYRSSQGRGVVFIPGGGFGNGRGGGFGGGGFGGGGGGGFSGGGGSFGGGGASGGW